MLPISDITGIAFGCSSTMFSFKRYQFLTISRHRCISILYSIGVMIFSYVKDVRNLEMMAFALRMVMKTIAEKEDGGDEEVGE